jgi:hypothetical protein
MSKRGRIPLEIKLGEPQFKALINSTSIEDIAEQVCNHQVDREKKRTCKACKRTIYRASERLRHKEREEKTFAAIDDFEAIPEIQQYLAYSKAKYLGHDNVSQTFNRLKRMWTWVKENPEFADSQRPIMWQEKHLVFILGKIEKLNIARYHDIQALRRLFEANKRNDMLKNLLLRAKAKDLRSPKGQTRTSDRFTPTELMDILKVCSPDEAFYIQLHVTLKCREGNKEKASILNLKWSDINWNDNFYGFEMVTARVFESKTGGGMLWEHCPIDLWWSDLSAKLKERYERRTSDWILPYKKQQYETLWQRISKTLHKDYQPHDCRRSPSGWLVDLDLPSLALGQCNMTSGRAIGFTGAGWENSKVFFDRYGKMNPQAIYDKRLKLNTDIFTGLIKKILEQKQ